MHTGFCPLLFGVAVGLSPDVLHSCFQEQARAVGQGGSFPSTAADFEGYAKRINDMGPLAKIVEGACHYLARYGCERSQTDGADVATERLRRLQQSNSRSFPPAYPTVDQVDSLYHITSDFLADTLDGTENLFDKIFPGLGGEVSPENICGESVGLKGNGIPTSVEEALSGPSSFIPTGGNLTGLDRFISSNFGNASCSGDSPFDFNTTLNFSDPTLVGPPTDIDIIFEGPFGSNQTFRVRNLPTADLTFPQQDVGVEFPPGTAALGNFTNEEIEEDENTEGPETSLLQKIQNATGGAGQLFDRIRLKISVARLSRCAQDLADDLRAIFAAELLQEVATLICEVAPEIAGLDGVDVACAVVKPLPIILEAFASISSRLSVRIADLPVEMPCSSCASPGIMLTVSIGALCYMCLGSGRDGLMDGAEIQAAFKNSETLVGDVNEVDTLVETEHGETRDTWESLTDQLNSGQDPMLMGSQTGEGGLEFRTPDEAIDAVEEAVEEYGKASLEYFKRTQASLIEAQEELRILRGYYSVPKEQRPGYGDPKFVCGHHPEACPPPPIPLPLTQEGTPGCQTEALCVFTGRQEMTKDNKKTTTKGRTGLLDNLSKDLFVVPKTFKSPLSGSVSGAESGSPLEKLTDFDLNLPDVGLDSLKEEVKLPFGIARDGGYESDALKGMQVSSETGGDSGEKEDGGIWGMFDSVFGALRGGG
uniref:Uncharacterized protein n=1 Tax=Chromera velia CCMP2878 TaxID=1169474 RepID=A0A0G4FNS4_9ALVE|eukprot:Cvel_17980.t1-p1 / transcript=Cvel_17980.t1 / gene=Cvel_17980 / organism=Chromera_velia_CCMP2878 / gene_product=hypothetical protein / transcript_product=hypothetical protein / location=Cvel_scaffold1464:19883-25654(-) / protein_length=707 / sequence_SO=supercontig / SO=protein_coding / is_pseudo=false